MMGLHLDVEPLLPCASFKHHGKFCCFMKYKQQNERGELISVRCYDMIKIFKARNFHSSRCLFHIYSKSKRFVIARFDPFSMNYETLHKSEVVLVSVVLVDEWKLHKISWHKKASLFNDLFCLKLFSFRNLLFTSISSSRQKLSRKDIEECNPFWSQSWTVTHDQV